MEDRSYSFSSKDLELLIENAVIIGVRLALEQLFGQRAEVDEKVKFLTRKQVCEYLGITIPTFHSYVKNGMIKTVKIGRRVLVSKKDLDDSLRFGQIKRYSHRASVDREMEAVRYAIEHPSATQSDIYKLAKGVSVCDPSTAHRWIHSKRICQMFQQEIERIKEIDKQIATPL